MKRQPLQPSFSGLWPVSRAASGRQQVRQTLGLVGALAALGLGAGALGAIELLLPQVVQAYTAQDLITVSWVAGEDYTALAKRAEDAARTMAQQRFDSDILLTRVLITVLGQYGGQTAPILVMDVNRPDWRNRPDPRYWSQYYRSTPALLGLEGVAPTGTLQPPGTQPTPAQPIPPPSPLPTPEAQPVAPETEQAPAPAPAAQPPIFPPPRPSSTRRAPGRSVQNQAPGTSFSPAPGSAPNPAPASPQPAAPSSAPNPVPANPQPTSETPTSEASPRLERPEIDLPAVPAGVGIPGSLR